MAQTQRNITGGGLLARNVLWNLLGTGAPLLVAIATIPFLIANLGTARFGVLTLAWMVVGYFSLFDLGLGRALTKLVAEKLGTGRDEELLALIRTALTLMAIFGVLGGCVVASLSPWLVSAVLKIPLELQPETLIAFYILAASIPIVIGTTGLRGILEAHQRFGLVNAVRIPLGVLTFLGPLAVLPFSNSLIPVVAVLVLTRLISWFAYAAFCMHIESGVRYSAGIHLKLVRPLMSFGGWMTVSNIVGPFMVYLDRFLVGAMVSMSAVAYYATPYEVITKLGVVPSALMGVVFPALATTLLQDRARAIRLYQRAVSYIFVALFPIVLITVTFAREGLDLWLGTEFASNSTLVLQLLAIGVLVNSHSQVPFGMIQGAGRPDLTAKLHLAELGFYLALLWWLLGAYGIVGAAVAWVARVTVDAILLFVIAQRLVPVTNAFAIAPILVGGCAIILLAIGGVISGAMIKIFFVFLTLLIFVPAAWFIVLAEGDRAFMASLFKPTPSLN